MHLAPVISWRDDDAADDMHAACVESGFFVVTDHGLDRTVTAALEAARTFFAEAQSVKELVARTDRYGYVPTCAQRIDPNRACGTVEYVDLGLADEVPLSHVGYLATAVRGYQRQALTLARELLTAMALRLGAERDAFTRHMHAPQCRLRLLRYPAGAALPDSAGVPMAPPLAMAPHTDYGAITLLATDGVSGLEILGADGAWHDVEVPPDSLIVNLGDMLARWTNDVYRSTPHRVRAVTTDRYSMPFFINPDPATIVEPLAACAASHPPLRHRPVLAGEFLRHRIDTGGYDRPNPADCSRP